MWHIFVDCSPYALFITWKTSKDLQSFAISSTLSEARGAKQLLVLKTHAIFSGFSSMIFFSSELKSVLSSSPTRIFSIIIGVKPARTL